MATPTSSNDAQALSTAMVRTRAAQHTASDPGTSAWVSANAGTGKTYVLTTRVMRLLLSGTKPERILALTFTKAAAAEMSKRVFDRLGTWVTAAPDKLAEMLREVLGRTPDANEMNRARQLFAVAIETPGGLKVQTIHGFCERLLKRFPLEAGIPPQFAILDESAATALLREAIDGALINATRHPNSALARALRVAITFAADDSFDDVLIDSRKPIPNFISTQPKEVDSHDMARCAHQIAAIAIDANVFFQSGTAAKTKVTGLFRCDDETGTVQFHAGRA